MDRFYIEDGVPCGYERTSPAIVDRDTGEILVILDPSEGEYAEACSVDTANMLIKLLNKGERE